MLLQINHQSGFIRFKSTLFLLILLSYNIILANIDNNLIKKIQANLDKLDKATIEFTQNDKNGNFVMGQLLVQRPYFFRCNYYTPYPLLITGGKKYVSIYDYEMDTITRLKANENIISVLFKNDWYNNDNFKIVETSEDEDNFIIKIFISESDQRSDVVFDKKSLNLVRISIFEMGEQNININFRMPLAVKSFKKGLFEIKDPATFGKPRQFNKEEIAQQYELN